VSFNTESTFDFQRGFLTIANLVGTYLTIKVGQFEPHILSFNNYRKIGGPDYWFYSRSAEASRWNSTVVRGINFSGTVGGRFGYDVAYVQGVEGAYGTDAIRQVPRDGYAHAYVKIGGLGLDGREPGGSAPGSGDAGGGGGSAGTPVRETSLLLGGFFYGGQHDVDTEKPMPEQDLLYKAGGDAYLLWKRFDLLLAAAYERHQLQQSGTSARLQALAGGGSPLRAGGSLGDVGAPADAAGDAASPHQPQDPGLGAAGTRVPAPPCVGQRDPHCSHVCVLSRAPSAWSSPRQ
jgi:hypothetical protein